MPGRSGLEVCQALRAEPDPYFRDVPVVMLTGQAGAADTAAGFAAGVTDYVTKPFKPTYIRSRVQTWLLRRRAGAPEDAFWALGFRNQIVAVVPSEGIVAVRLGSQPPADAPFTQAELTMGVLDALEGR